jgi:hypothetical protein
MPTNTGSGTIDTLLAARNLSAAEFGMSTVQEILNADLAVHNALMAQAIGEFAAISTDKQRIYGASARGKMVRVDEHGRAPTQRVGKNGQVAFPLDLFQYNIGWTRTWEKEKTPADFAEAMQGAQKAHRIAILGELKRAVFLSGNYTHTDDLVDGIQLNVKRLLNGDSAPIPDGPNGEVYNVATHNHYLASAAFDQTLLLALIATVVEHGHGGKVRVYINAAQENTVRGFANFVAYQDPRIILATNANQANARLDITRLDNRAIGLLGAAEVWVKPWVPALYAFCFDVDYPQKPAHLRERTPGSMQLQIAAIIDMHPLVAEFMEAKFGIGVWSRTNGAVAFGGGGAYVDPAITY